MLLASEDIKQKQNERMALHSCFQPASLYSPPHLFFPVLFLFDWVGGLLPQLSKVLKIVCWVGVPGEIKRSRDLRGGRWSWTLTFAQKRS